MKAFRSENHNPHKLKVDIVDTQMAEVVNDEIFSYKFSSLIKYFSYLSGENNFIKGMKIFIEKFYLKTANINDFKDVFKDQRFDDLNPINILECYIDHEGLSKLEIVKKNF